MGIVLVVFFWLLFLAALALIFLGLGLLTRRFYVAGVVRDGFVSLILVFVFLAGLVTVIGFGNFILDNLVPSRIFTRNFGFPPTDDVQNLQGSNRIFGKNGFGEINLKFRSSNITAERIISQKLFVEQRSSQFKQVDDKYLQGFLDNPHVHLYVSSHFDNYCDKENSACAAIFVHDEESGQTYFVRY